MLLLWTNSQLLLKILGRNITFFPTSLNWCLLHYLPKTWKHKNFTHKLQLRQSSASHCNFFNHYVHTDAAIWLPKSWLVLSTSCCKANTKVMGRGKFRPPRLPVNRFWWSLNYSTTSRAWSRKQINPCGIVTTWVVLANTWHITHFRFSVDLFSFFLYSWDCAAPPPVDRFRQSIRHLTCFHARMCILWAPLLTLSIYGIKPPPKKTILGE